MSRPTGAHRRRGRTTAWMGAGAAALVLATLVGQPGQSADSAAAVARSATLDQVGSALAVLAPVDGSATGSPVEDHVNVELTSATLDPSGLAERAVLISRLTATGPAEQVVDPASVTNVRYLDRIGRPEVSGDGVLLEVGGDHPMVLTEARFDKPLPVALHVEYALGGQVLPATDVPGTSGDLTVTYTLTNTTATSQTLHYTDAAGTELTSTEPVFAPYQGTLTVTLPADAVLVDGGGAILGSDEQGRTVAQWNVALYPPISQPVAQLALTLRTTRAAIPAAEVLLTPATVDQVPATEFSATLLDSSEQGSSTLYDGLRELNASAGALADGSAQLSGAVGELSTGTTAAAGAAEEVAGGLGVLTDGADKLADGARQLAAGLGTTASGADDLAAATAELAAAAAASDPAEQLAPLLTAGAQIQDGLAEVAARIGGPNDAVLDPDTPLTPDDDDLCPDGGTAPPDDDCVTLYQGVSALHAGLTAIDALARTMGRQIDETKSAGVGLIGDLGSIAADSGSAAQSAAQLYAGLCRPDAPTLDPASCTQLAAVAAQSGSAAGTAAGAVPVATQIAATLTVLGKEADALGLATRAALATTDRLLVAVTALGRAVGEGDADQPGLTAAMTQLNAGLAELATTLSTGSQELSQALSEVASGSEQLATGVGAAAGGADDLATGGSQLAEGTGSAQDGADQLASGLGVLAEGAGSAAGAADAVATGADQLQTNGTAPAVEGVLDSSTDPALAQAWLAAAGDRAADALPYGPPTGWSGQAVYSFQIEAVAAPQSLWDRIRGLFGR